MKRMLVILIGMLLCSYLATGMEKISEAEAMQQTEKSERQAGETKKASTNRSVHASISESSSPDNFFSLYIRPGYCHTTSRKQHGYETI